MTIKFSDTALTDERSLFNNSSPSGAVPTATPTAQTVDVMDYNTMSTAELNNEYDRVRKAGDVLKATKTGWPCTVHILGTRSSVFWSDLTDVCGRGHRLKLLMSAG